MANFKIGSLFDGSGGFPLAAALCGGAPVWASEVEPYPIAVTRSRFPGMKHLGDISKVNGAEIEPVDVITFGSPCQDLSVAGKRAGLKHEAAGDDETTRSGLFMEAVRIIKEMRTATDGRYPTFAIWENVPGAFSSNKGEDFHIVLEELVKIAEPNASVPPMSKGGWPYADAYMGDGWSVAYRTFDAQYWGVPQRRRRIHLVADFRGERAAEILFEREGLRGYFEAGGTPWKGTAGDTGDGAAADDRTRECIISNVVYDARGNGDGAGDSTITGDHESRITDYTSIVCMATQQGGAEITENGVCPTITAAAGMSGNNQPVCCFGVSSFESNAMKSPNPHSGIYEAITSRTLDLNGGNPACNQSGIDVVEAQTVSIEGNGSRPSHKGDGYRESDKMYTLNTTEVHGVCYAATYQETTGPLMANSHPGSYSGQDAYSDMLVVGKDCAGVDCRNMKEYSELYPTLQAKPNGGQSLNYSGAVRIRYIVRRLTPTECARLQGFADQWGHPDQKTNFSNEEYMFWLEVRNTHAEINGKTVKQYTKEQLVKWYNKLHVDGSEYKMWGNGIALPPALYVMQGIQDVLGGGADG